MEAAAIVSRWLITIGVMLVAVRLLWPWRGKLGLGRPPGDIAIGHGIFAI